MAGLNPSFEHTGAERRRSPRIYQTVPVNVAWTQDNGDRITESAETEVFNTYGGLLRMKPRLPIPLTVQLTNPHTAESTRARVVGFRDPLPEGFLRVAVELAGPSQTFWTVPASVPLPADVEERTARKHPRVRLITQVESRASGATSIGRTENISVGGILILSRETFDRRTEVIVRFNLPEGRAVEAEGLVMHCEPRIRMGIQFLRLSDADRHAVAEFVKQSCE